MTIGDLLVPPLEAYYQTEYGAAYLGDSLESLGHIPDKSINLILTSPPFALTRKKEYGNKNADEYIEWFLDFAKHFKRILKDDGSFVLDLGGAYLPGYPVRAIYQFELLIRLCKELGFFLAQDFYHYNPSRLPTPAEWVNIRRIRVKDSVNVVWWLSVTENPKANNRNVLKPYIEFLTEENDIVLDPFAGSNTTGQAAEVLRRKWLAFEIDQDYLNGSVYRFQEVNDLFAVRDKNSKTQQVRSDLPRKM